MSFDWRTYIELARLLMERAAEIPASEACYRSVASRAYYGAYHLARDFARDADDTVFSSDEHRSLQNHFLNHPYKVKKRLGNNLRKLHQYRKKADYDDELFEAPINTAAKALAKVKTILQDLDRLTGGAKSTL